MIQTILMILWVSSADGGPIPIPNFSSMEFCNQSIPLFFDNMNKSPQYQGKIKIEDIACYTIKK